MLIDEVLPRCDEAESRAVLVNADPATVYGIARNLDLREVRTPLVTTAFAVRGAPERLARRWRRQPPPAPPGPMRLADIGRGDAPPELGSWLVLGERPGEELVFGAVGRFWTPRIEWVTVDRAGYRDFIAPGYARIAANFAVVPADARRAVLIYEVRVAATDIGAAMKSRAYWRLVHPFVGHIMAATLNTIRDVAERTVGPSVRIVGPVPPEPPVPPQQPVGP